eukprot:TRINITY_DN5102_c0_g1_i4.p1 TRINITY_DN5102_c0_g1~~TRINITY_DN5102_c0_g1_i4.p1  ORF type:complete len:344 (-),score=63.89 TRINITY_DN5102_c0_g1_i4:186-1166(-)
MSELSREELLELLNQTKSKLAKKEGECDALKAEIKDNQRSQSLFADKMESRFKEFATTVKKGMFVEFQRMEKHLAEHAKDHANDQMEEVWTKYVEPKLEEINDGLINREDTKEQNYQDQIKELNDKISTDLIDIKSVCTGLQKDMETNITILDEKVNALALKDRPVQTKVHSHALIEFKCKEAYFCDECPKRFPEGSCKEKRFRCTWGCDYDLCEECFLKHAEFDANLVNAPSKLLQCFPTGSFYIQSISTFFQLKNMEHYTCLKCAKVGRGVCGLEKLIPANDFMGRREPRAICPDCIPESLVVGSNSNVPISLPISNFSGHVPF